MLLGTCCVTGLAALHIEMIETHSNGRPFSGSHLYTTVSDSNVASLIQYMAADEAALKDMTHLVSLSLVNMANPMSLGATPWEAVLAAIAATQTPKLQQLRLSRCGHLTGPVMQSIAKITSMVELDVSGSEVSEPDMIKIARLTQLTSLNAAGLYPSAIVLGAIAVTGTKLKQLTVGGLPDATAADQPLRTITELTLQQIIDGSNDQIIAAIRHGHGINSIRFWLPKLQSLSMIDWEVDSRSIAIITQLTGLRSLTIHGTSKAPVRAQLLLPLTSMTNLRELTLLGLTGLTDDWMADAMQQLGGSFPNVEKLQLGAVDVAVSDSQSVFNSDSDSGTAAAANLGLPPVGLSDRGLVRLFVCSSLKELMLYNFPGISLAGIKALSKGSAALRRVVTTGCPAVAAAPAESRARACVCANRVVDLCVLDAKT